MYQTVFCNWATASNFEAERQIKRTVQLPVTADAPNCEQKLPALQFDGALRPDVSQMNPIGHSTGDEEAAVQKAPVGQVMGLEVPSGQYVPALQFPSGAIKEEALQYMPEGQGSGAAEPLGQ